MTEKEKKILILFAIIFSTIACLVILIGVPYLTESVESEYVKFQRENREKAMELVREKSAEIEEIRKSDGVIFNENSRECGETEECDWLPVYIHYTRSETGYREMCPVCGNNILKAS